MEDEATTSQDCQYLLDPVSTAVSCENVASSSTEEPIQNEQLEEPEDQLESRELPRAVLDDLYKLILGNSQTENVSHRQDLPVNQPETYNCYPELVQPPADFPQSTAVIDPPNSPLAVDSEPPLLLPVEQQSTVFEASGQLYFLDEGCGEPAGIVYPPIQEQQAVVYVDVQQPGTSATGQYVPVFDTDSLPLVEQRHLEAAVEPPTAAVSDEEFNVSLPEVESSGSENQYSPRKRIRVKEYPCSQCDRKFISPEEAMIHSMRGHTGVKPFKCEFVGCKKTFPTNFKLTRHLKTHMKERPFKCTLCECTFPRRDNLETHKQSHSMNTQPETQST